MGRHYKGLYSAPTLAEHMVFRCCEPKYRFRDPNSIPKSHRIANEIYRQKRLQNHPLLQSQTHFTPAMFRRRGKRQSSRTDLPRIKQGWGKTSTPLGA